MWIPIDAELLNGVRPGPTVWLSGAIHGDEIVGAEVIRQILDLLDPQRLAGRIIAVPVVNVFGFITGSRYLPDRRDLNRGFPGSNRGSLASRMARLFIDTVVDRAEVGIDLHALTLSLARAFGAPIAIHGKGPAGSLRAAATKRGKRVLLYEGGEPRRFSRDAVETGVAGVLRVLEALEMVPDAPAAQAPFEESRKTRWVRAPRGGIFRLDTELGEHVHKGDHLGIISDPLGSRPVEVTARIDGVVIGHTVNPLVSQGDALVHIAEVR
jgi:predicted deacylase